jgi:hypothetical protein
MRGEARTTVGDVGEEQQAAREEESGPRAGKAMRDGAAS